MKKEFKTNYVDGSENVMCITRPVREIRFDVNSRSITVVYRDFGTYYNEDLDHLSWQELKRLTLEKGGVWTTKKDAIAFLIGKEK